MAAPPTEAELTSSTTTTIDSLPFEILTGVLLRVPTPAALVHAAAASRSWRGAIANLEFLARYRERHKSSPFLGLYIPRRLGGPPTFQMPDSIHCAGDDTGSRHLKDAALKAFNIGGVRRYQDHRLHDAVDDAFIPGPLGVHPDCRLLDCHNSRLLLTRGDEALEVRSPLARDSILLPFPPDVHPDSLQACLLQAQDEAASSFRVVCLQHRHEGRKRQVRAVEYDSSRKSWQDHPWETPKSNIEGPLREVMRAGHRIFWKYQGPTTSSLLLDTRNMVFSDHCLPSEGNFAIGEIADNVCGLVETVGCESHRLRVWQLVEDKLDWKLEKDTEMDQVLGKHMGYYRPRAIGNGIALVCSITTCHHFLVDLNTCSMKEKLEFHGQSAYLMQMPWPPAFSGPISNVTNPGSSKDGSNENQHELRDGVAALNSMPSNEPQYLNIQDPTTTAPTTPAAAEQCFGKDNYVPNDYLIPDLCNQFSDLVHPEVIGSHHPERRESYFRLEQGARCHPKYCVKDPKIPDDVQIATSCCIEASAASTAAVSVGECKLLWGGTGSTIKLPDAGKQPIIDASITSAPSLSDHSAGESEGLDIQDPTATAPTPATAEQCFGKDKNYVPNDDLYLIPDPCQTRPEPSPSPSLGCCFSTGPSQEEKMARLLYSSSIACSVPGTSCRNQDTAPATAPPDLLTTSSPAEYMEDQQQMALTTMRSPSCPQQGRKWASSRESKGCPEAMGIGRCNWKPKPKYLEAIFALRRRHSFSIASKVSDEVQIATSSCREVSAASTAAGGFDRDGGPASVGDARTGSGESDAIEGCGAGGAAFARVEEPGPSRTESNLINHDLLLQPPALASYPACSKEPKPFSRTASKP